MRNLFAIFSCLITVSLFGQNHRLGEFYNGSNHQKSKGLNYKLKTPLNQYFSSPKEFNSLLFSRVALN